MTGMRGEDQQDRRGGQVHSGPARRTVVMAVLGVIVLVAVVLLIVWFGNGGTGVGGGY